MKLSKLFAISALCCSLPAMAMPAFDGTYQCSANGKTVSMTLETRDNSLFVSGIDATGGLVQTDKGLPCETNSMNQSANGVTVVGHETCDASSLGLSVAMSAPSQNINIQFDLKFTAISPNAVNLSIHSQGTVNGSPMNVDQSITCTK